MANKDLIWPGLKGSCIESINFTHRVTFQNRHTFVDEGSAGVTVFAPPPSLSLTLEGGP